MLTDIRDTAQPGTGVAYFFCSSLQEEACEPLELLGSVLRQLCEQQLISGSVPDEISVQRDTVHSNGPNWQKIFDQRDTVHSTRPNRQQITKALSLVVSGFAAAFLICDGLDECRDQRKISEFLLLLSQAQTAVVKVLLLSRPDYKDLEEVLAGCPVVQMDMGANDNDIKKFIGKKLSAGRIPVRNENQLLDTQKTVFNKAEGMFLYINLLSETLLQSRTLN